MIKGINYGNCNKIIIIKFYFAQMIMNIDYFSAQIKFMDSKYCM